MRVFYTGRQAKRGPVVYEQAGPTKFCCAGMCRWWGSLIGFGVRDVAASTSRDVSLYTDRPQANGKTALVLTAVEFCPWCGEVVETCRVK